jgi:hypothetical protein
MESAHESSVIKALDDAVTAHATLRSSHDGRTAANVLKKFRNWRLAHSVVEQSSPVPRFQDLSLLLDVATKIAAASSLAVLGRPWDVEDTSEVRRHQGRAFWEPGFRGIIDHETK